MERPAICSSCGGMAKPAYTCTLCGAVVCAKCYLVGRNICKKCAAGRMMMDGS